MRHKILYLSTVLLLYTGILTWFWVSHYHPLFLESYHVRLINIFSRLSQDYESDLHAQRYISGYVDKKLSANTDNTQRQLDGVLKHFAKQINAQALFVANDDGDILAGAVNLEPDLIEFILNKPKPASRTVAVEELRLYEVLPNYLFYSVEPLKNSQAGQPLYLYKVQWFKNFSNFFPDQLEAEFDFTLLPIQETWTVSSNILPVLGSRIEFKNIESLALQSGGLVDWKAQLLDLNGELLGEFAFTSYWKPSHVYFFKSLSLYLIILLLGIGIVLWVVYLSSKSDKEVFKFAELITGQDININPDIPLDKAGQSVFRHIQKTIDSRTKKLENIKKAAEIKNEILADTLERFNPGISDLIFKGKQELGIVEASVMIMDTVGYTAKNMVFGEVMVSKLMNQMFRFSHIAIARYGGYKDKMVGDQIIAIYGIDKDETQGSDTHAIDSILAGMDVLRSVNEMQPHMQQLVEEDKDSIQKRYATLDKDLKSALDLDNIRFDVRLGINSSKADSSIEIDRLRMVTMGGETGLDYTGQGGAFICAARLESNAMAGSIHIGINTKRAVDHLVKTVEIEPIMLKGLGQQRRFEVTEWIHILNFAAKSKAADLYYDDFPKPVLNSFYELNVGEIYIKEISKLHGSEVVPVHYYEHTTGHRSVALARSFFAYAVAKNLGLSEVDIDKAVYFSAWRSVEDTFREYDGAKLKKKYLLEDQVPFKVSPSDTAFLLRDIRVDKPTTLLGQVCKLASRYDQLQFDRSYKYKKEGKILNHNQTLKRMLLEFPEHRRIVDQFDQLFKNRT